MFSIMTWKALHDAVTSSPTRKERKKKEKHIQEEKKVGESITYFCIINFPKSYCIKVILY